MDVQIVDICEDKRCFPDETHHSRCVLYTEMQKLGLRRVVEDVSIVLRSPKYFIIFWRSRLVATALKAWLGQWWSQTLPKTGTKSHLVPSRTFIALKMCQNDDVLMISSNILRIVEFLVFRFARNKYWIWKKIYN